MRTVELVIRVTAGGVGPQVPVYDVEVTTKEEEPNGGSWEETFGSLEQLNAFITGIKAGLAFSRDTSVIGLPSGFNEFHIRNRLHEAPFQLWPDNRWKET